LPLFEVFAKRRDLAVFVVNCRGHSILAQASVGDTNRQDILLFFVVVVEKAQKAQTSLCYREIPKCIFFEFFCEANQPY
jgi:hypothetical protein